MLLELKQFHSATVFHQNILDKVTFYQRVAAQGSRFEGANIAGGDYDTVRH